MLRPVYENQPAHLHAVKGYKEQRANYLEQTGQRQEALALRKQLAQDYPRDFNSQHQYVQALVRMGEYEAGYAWLERVLSADSARLSMDVCGPACCRTKKTGCGVSMPRCCAPRAAMTIWSSTWPSGSSAIRPVHGLINNISALWSGPTRPTRLIGWLPDWLKDGRRSGELPPEVAGRLHAAVELALGQGHTLYTNRIDERWLKPLGEAALFFARHPSQSHLAESDHEAIRHFPQTDECRRVRKAAAGILRKEIDATQPRRDCPVRKLDLARTIRPWSMRRGSR